MKEVICSPECSPYCYLCKYIKEDFSGCLLHEDENHQELAKGGHYCRDFKCKYADRKERNA